MPCSIIVFHKIIYSNSVLFYDPVSVCKLSSPELSYCVQSPALVTSESGLGGILEDGSAAAASDGGQHVTVSPLPLHSGLADPLLNSIIGLTFSTTCSSSYLCPELTQRYKFINCLADLILASTAPVSFGLCSAKVLTVQPVISQCEVFASSAIDHPHPLNSIPSFL